MIACVDVDYRDLSAVAACICFQQWNDSTLVLESAIEIRDVEPYEPGRFYRRELPRIVCASRVLETV